MNTVKSFWVGWGALCVAGGGAYYFAKKSINADKMARFEAEQKRKRFQNSLNHSSGETASEFKNPKQKNGNDSSSVNFNHNTENEKEEEKSKYEPARPFRSLKGDRFS